MEFTNLTRTGGWNPFIVYVNGSRYEVKNIHFYENGRVRASVGRGWFGNNNRIDSLPIPEVRIRRKPAYDGGSFIIGKAGECELYIPIGYFDFDVTTLTENKGYYHNEYDVYTSKINPLVAFIDYSSRKEVVDFQKKEWAETLTVFIGGIETALAPLKEELEKLDFHGRLAAERKASGLVMEDKNITKIIADQLYALRYEVIIRKEKGLDD